MAAGLSCARLPGDLEEAIRSGWPAGAPSDYALIGTITGLTEERGDANTWGETLTVRVDAVLRGELPLSEIQIYNPPTGAAGWVGFAAGRQYFIVASDAEDGRISTWACPPNEEVTSTDRFAELVAISLAPRVSNTAMTAPEAPTAPLALTGVVLISLAMLAAVRRSMQGHDRFHRRDD